MAALRRRALAYRAALVKCFCGPWLPVLRLPSGAPVPSVVMLCLKQKTMHQPDARLQAARVPAAAQNSRE